LAKRLLGALTNSRGHRHEENAARVVNVAREQPLQIGVALLASAEGYTPRANQLIDAAREQIAELADVASALADNLPAPKVQGAKSRRRRRRKRAGPQQPGTEQPKLELVSGGGSGGEPSPPKRRRRRRPKPAQQASPEKPTGDPPAPAAEA